MMHHKRGFLDIGYHYVIRRDGTLETGRDETVTGAHVRGYNHLSIGICMVEGSLQEIIPATRTRKKTYKLHPEDNFTDAQYKTLYRLLNELRMKHPKAEILGHRDLPGVTKSCPSFDVHEWFNFSYDM